MFLGAFGHGEEVVVEGSKIGPVYEDLIDEMSIAFMD